MIIKASEIRKGTQLAEADGFLFEDCKRNSKNRHSPALLQLLQFQSSLDNQTGRDAGRRSQDIPQIYPDDG